MPVAYRRVGRCTLSLRAADQVNEIRMKRIVPSHNSLLLLRRTLLLAALFCGIGFTLPALAQEPRTLAPEPSPGQADLDAATKLKLRAARVQDLANVIELAESALEAGLVEEDAAWAKTLISATRHERATLLSSPVLDQQPPDPRWQQYRRLALADLVEAIKYDPDNPELHLLQARLYALPGADGDREKALAAYQRAIDTSGGDDTTKSKAYAYRAAIREDPAQRAADLDASIELDPSNLEAVNARAMAWLEAGDYERAVPDLQKIITLEPDNPQHYITKAMVLAMLERVDESLAELNRAAELAPDDPAVYAQRARLYLLSNQFDKALEDGNRALSLNPRNPGVQLTHARVLQATGDTKAALKLVSRVLAFQPSMKAAIELRAQLLVELGRFDEAISGVERAVRGDPDSREMLTLLGTLYLANEDSEKAIGVFDQLLDNGLENARIYRHRGDALLSLARQSEALADYEKARQLQPQDPGILNNMAWLMATSPDEQLRNGSRAIELAEEACRITEYKEAYILSTLAAAHAESGDFDEAVKWAEKAVELGEGEVTDQLKAELESYRRREPWREVQGGSEEDGPAGDEPQAGEAPGAEAEEATESEESTDFDDDESPADPQEQDSAEEESDERPSL
ncbi:MAG: hypothetical protein DWQ35_08840 [Planctomycetota bacterium]|nr:MAG: hypothetical protein DWQ35_08840 [Planctomycetota bacterium]REK26303.1 MAG: hypothetical protein DWQ42_09430 [Planctomycetota bacterium]REK45854.1 MAG: hypothetical protein DWQ46_08145 [Planctomycetota bacterium]